MWTMYPAGSPPAIVPHPVVVDRIRMKCVRHGDFKITDFLRAALAHRTGLLFEALALNPQTRLKDCRNFRFVLFGQSQKVAHVIGMRVGQENGIQPRHFFQRFRTEGIRHHPRIDQSNLPRGRRQRKRVVAKISDAIALGIEHRRPPPQFFSLTKYSDLDSWQYSSWIPKRAAFEWPSHTYPACPRRAHVRPACRPCYRRPKPEGSHSSPGVHPF